MSAPDCPPAAGPKRAPKRSQIDRTTALVLQTTAALLRESGYRQLTVERIVQRSGVARSTVYRHWKNVAELAVQAFDNAIGPNPPTPDLGDIRAGAALEETHDRLHAVVRHCQGRGLKVVVLGGGNDISYPDCSALAAEVASVLAFNVDRHLDVRADPVRNSGTPYRQLLEEGFLKPGGFHEVGINSFANSLAYRRYLEDLGVGIHYLADLRARGVGAGERSQPHGADRQGDLRDRRRGGPGSPDPGGGDQRGESHLRPRRHHLQAGR